MTDSERSAERPSTPAADGWWREDGDWWRDDAEDFRSENQTTLVYGAPAGAPEPVPFAEEPMPFVEEPVLEGDLIEPAPRPVPVAEAEIIDADVVDDPGPPAVVVRDYVAVAEPTPDAPDAADPEPFAAPRPFDAAPRVTARAPAPPPPPARPAPPAPLLWPAPVPDPLPPPRPRSDVEPATVQAGLPAQHRARPADAPRPARPPRNRRPPVASRPWLAMPAVVLIALAGAFFAWVSAEPFWLSVGHGTAGTAVVVASADGCRATFAGPGFTRSTVELATASGCAVGATMPARMVSADAARAYAASRLGLVHRWSAGYLMVLLCGLLLARVIGTDRYQGWARAGAVALSLGAPLAVAAALLAAAF